MLLKGGGGENACVVCVHLSRYSMGGKGHGLSAKNQKQRERERGKDSCGQIVIMQVFVG